jgi:1-deoxy-D-xylulose 5-phosphate reductoisomerase
VVRLGGFSGVLPTICALEKGIDVALANKEVLVSAGKFVSEISAKSGAKIIAIDSEHNAILQCLIGEDMASVEKIILTASGGPFLGAKFRKPCRSGGRRGAGSSPMEYGKENYYRLGNFDEQRFRGD